MGSNTLKLSLVTLIVVCTSLALSAGSARAGEPTLYELPVATHAGALAVSPDGTVWFVPSRGELWKGKSSSIIASLAPDGTLSEHKLAGFGAINRIAVSPGGELWVAGFKETKVGRVLLELGRLTSAGALERRYFLGAPEASYARVKRLAITDGVVWFINGRGRGNVIERFSVANGTARQVVPPRRRCEPVALAAGPSEEVWFSETCREPEKEGLIGPGRIGQITRDGTVTGRSIRVPGSPISITIGEDRTVWVGIYSPFARGWIGRVTAQGDQAEYRVQTPYPTAIAVGLGGNLWFGGDSGPRPDTLTSIDAAGDLSAPICPGPMPLCELSVTGLTAAPDGSLWYGLQRPNLNTGGGGSGLGIDAEIRNEAGFIAHLVPPA